MNAIINNNAKRLWNQKHLLVIFVLFITVATVAAIFVSTRLTHTFHVAVTGHLPAGVDFDHIKVSELDTAPLRSELLSGKYDAILRINETGGYEIDSIKNEDTVHMILNILEGQPETAAFSDRGTGTDILGYLMMFLLLMGSMAMCMYSDDKEKNQIIRVAASPVNIGTYLLAHSLFNFLFLYLPTLTILTAIRWVSGVDYGYSFLQLAGLLALICAFSTAFCLFLYSLFSNKAEGAKMAGNAIIILTSILSGGFYAFDKGNSTLGHFIAILPQKAYLTVAEGVTQHVDVTAYLPALVYLLLITTVLFVVAVIKTKRDYVCKH